MTWRNRNRQANGVKWNVPDWLNPILKSKVLKDLKQCDQILDIKIIPKSNRNSFWLKCENLQMEPKNICKKLRHWELSKIAQSGHTVLKTIWRDKIKWNDIFPIDNLQEHHRDLFRSRLLETKKVWSYFSLNCTFQSNFETNLLVNKLAKNI